AQPPHVLTPPPPQSDSTALPLNTFGSTESATAMNQFSGVQTGLGQPGSSSSATALTSGLWGFGGTGTDGVGGGSTGAGGSQNGTGWPFLFSGGSGQVWASASLGVTGSTPGSVLGGVGVKAQAGALDTSGSSGPMELETGASGVAGGVDFTQRQERRRFELGGTFSGGSIPPASPAPSAPSAPQLDATQARITTVTPETEMP
ncbi:hypothetical protein HK102_011738, partial [Quaeritorhiza haematococci]